MSTRSLITLSIITVLVVLAAVVTVWFDNRSSRPIEPEPLVPGLSERLSDITEIVLREGEDSITLTLVDGEWVLSEQGGYPARVADIRELLLTLSELTRIERKTSQAPLRGELGLDGGPQTARVIIRAGDELLTDLWVGNTTTRGTGRFVRLEGEDAAWITSGIFAIDPTVPAWTNTDLMRLGSDFIRSIRIEPHDAEAFVITRQGSGQERSFTIDPMPKGREIGSDFELDRLFSSLAFLTFIDVRSLDAKPIPVSAFTLRYTTTAGSEFAVRYWTEPTPTGPIDGWISFEFQRSQTDASPTRPLEGWAFKVTPYAAEGFEASIDGLTFYTDEDLTESILGPIPNSDGP